VIHHRMAFQQLDLLLPAQLPKQLPDLVTQLSIDGLLAIFWYNKNNARNGRAFSILTG
jgi:hypothetical protein